MMALALNNPRRLIPNDLALNVASNHILIKENIQNNYTWNELLYKNTEF